MTKITEYLELLLEGQDLTFDQARDLQDRIFSGDVADVQVAAFLTAMRIKKATAEELAGLARSLRDHAVKVNVADIDGLIDTCGSGGAVVKTFNISTAAALVAAGAGCFVAKHGNRAITSKCGSADVLAGLGVKIDCGPQLVEKCIRQAHIGFMFAPMFHPAMKFVQPIRKSLDFRTAFNILGPLANPADVKAQVMGVPDEGLMERIAKALVLLGAENAMVVHSSGLDEISTMAETKIYMIKGGAITKTQISPADFGIEIADSKQLRGGDTATNTEIIRNIINGKENGCKKDIVVLNAAAAIVTASLAKDFDEGIIKAKASIADRAAADCLKKLIEISNS
ncbi:MAG: anthranilate phosphoribosyltransferase [Planctomycetes bacterium]|nr:anthranilate phosphoribosyltransferase [Planctomycetota bacterium]